VGSKNFRRKFDREASNGLIVGEISLSWKVRRVRGCCLAIASKEKILNEGALGEEMEATDIRTVYDFPVAGHLCSDGAVHYVKLTRRSGSPKHQGVCAQCQTTFQYEKPQRSRVRHYGLEDASQS
jgi:hypothetical protein